MPNQHAEPPASRRGDDPQQSHTRVKEGVTPLDLRQQRLQLLGRWWTVVCLLLLIIAICASLWHFRLLRPYLAGLGAGLGAFLTPLPALIQPETRGKWQFAIALSCVVGLGTWFSIDTIQNDRDRLEKKRDEAVERLQSQRSAFEEWLKRLPGAQQSTFLLYGQGHLLGLFRKHQFEAVVDFAQLLAAIDQGNGHGLYYEGEGYRCLGRRTDMRGAFRRYLQIADHHPESRIGDAYTCSQRPSGYCGERTAWVNHIMAHDSLRQARASSIPQAVNSTLTAIRYEREALRIRPQGFDQEGSFDSSCALLHAFSSELAILRQPTREAEGLLNSYRSRFGAC